MNKAKFISFASVISEIQQSDLFMTVKARILETPKANLNGAAVTPAFVDDIIANEERYVGLPLYADIKALERGNYNRLGHLYDSKTGEFHSTQIGSFYQFEKEDFNGGSYLVGYARIPKRNKVLSKAIAELFADGALKFSFEICCADYTEAEDGTFVIDASENNYLEGTAIVTFPACEDAVALEFVAQREADDTERGEKEMAEVDKLEVEQALEPEQKLVAEEETEATESQPEQEAVAEQETEPNQEATAEENKEAEEAEVTAESETPESQEPTETAEVYVTETHVEETHTRAFDTETGKEVCQSVEVRTSVSMPMEGNLVDTDEGTAVAEKKKEDQDDTPDMSQTDKPAQKEDPQVSSVQSAPETTDPQDANSDPPGDNNGGTTVPAEADPEQVDEVPAECKKDKKTAEEMIAELTVIVQELAEEVKSLKEIKAVASQNVTAEAINPFMDSMSTNGTKYDLLEPVEKPNGYSLLSR